MQSKVGKRSSHRAQKGSKTKGGGGPWRAFCREKSAGSKLTEESAGNLSAQYWALTNEEFAYYTEVGRLATIAHRLGLKSFGSFGLGKMKTNTFADLIHSDEIRRLELEAGSSAIVPTGACLDSDLLLRRRLLAKEMAKDRVKHRQQQAADNAEVKKFLDRAREDEDVDKRPPLALSRVDPVLHALPNTSIKTFEVIAPAAAWVKRALLKIMNSKTGLMQMLQRYWEQRHHIYVDKDQPRLGKLKTGHGAC